jgi:hypothetical protein
MIAALAADDVAGLNSSSGGTKKMKCLAKGETL